MISDGAGVALNLQMILYISSYGKGNETNPLRRAFALYWRIISATNGIEFVSDRMSCKTIHTMMLLVY
jgi:hypothetical protein